MPRKADPALGPYPVAVRRFPKIRQSTLSAFDSCALASKFEADLRNGWSTHPQARGTVFHRTAAECLRTMSRLGERTIPVDVAHAHLAEVLRQTGVDRQCPRCKSTKIRKGLKEGNRTCGSCNHRFPTEMLNLPSHEVKDLYWVVVKWANDNEWDIENLMDVEDRLDVPVAYPDGKGGSFIRTVTGQIDAVFMAGDDHAIVLDWKDTWGLPGPTDISFEGYFQQRMYGWLLMRTYPALNRVTLREFYVRFSEPREVTLWREDIDQVEQEFTAMVERFDRSVHEGVFSPTPGKHCHWCMRPGMCTIDPHVRLEGRIRSEAEAVQITKQQVIAKANYEQTTEALRAWANFHGPIPIKDAKGKRQLGFRETETTVRPSRDQLEQAIREAGSAGGLVLDDLFKTRKGTRFEQHAVPRGPVATDHDAVLLAQLEGALVAAREKS